jgi:hypothetical protein
MPQIPCSIFASTSARHRRRMGKTASGARFRFRGFVTQRESAVVATKGAFVRP